MKTRMLVASACAWVALSAATTLVPSSAQADDAATVAIDAALASKDRPKSDLEQDERRKAREVLTFAGVKPGMTVSDMFAADGYYTELLSRIYEIATEQVDPGVKVELTGRLTRPPFTVAHNRALFGLAQSIAGELAIPLFEVPATGGGSDGNFSAALGVPTLDGLGPVTTDTCSRDEKIFVDSLAERGALFAALVERLSTLSR